MPNLWGVVVVAAVGCSSPTPTGAVVCDPGTWNDHDVCVAWTDCPPGTILTSDGTSTSDRVCSACGDGTFNTGTNSTSCAALTGCGPGEYASTPGSTSNDRVCIPCQAGAFSAAANADVCAPWTACTGFVTAAGTPTTDEVCGFNFIEIGTGAFDLSTAVALDSNGNIYMVGQTTGAFPDQTNLGNYDAFLLKYDASGTLQWAEQFGTNTVDTATAVTVDSNNNIYVAGYTYGTFPDETNGGGDDAFLAKYDATGALQWAHQFGTDQGDFALGAAADHAGHIYVVGYTEGSFPGATNAGYSDVFVAQYDSGGTLQWTQQVGTGSFDNAYGVAVDSNNYAYVAGTTDTGAFLLQSDSTGAFQWWTPFSASDVTAAYGVGVDSNNNIYVTGWTTGTFPGQTSAGGTDAYVTCYDSTGANQWTRQFGTNSTDSASSVAVDSAGNIDVVGYTIGTMPAATDVGGYDGFLVSYDAQGTLHAQQFGTIKTDYAQAVTVDSTNSIYVAGYTLGTFPGQDVHANGGVYLAKLQP